VNNGIVMSRIHHKAYDSNLLGIDGDCKIHIRDDIKIIDDGSFSNMCFSELAGKNIWLPSNKKLRPNPGLTVTISFAYPKLSTFFFKITSILINLDRLF